MNTPFKDDRPAVPGDKREGRASSVDPLPTNKRLISRVMARSFQATPEEVEQYIDDGFDNAITYALLDGSRTQAEIAAAVGLSIGALQKRMRNPVRCAWISKSLMQLVPTAVGRVWAAVTAKAISGDIRAANLFLERWDPNFRRGASATIQGENIQVNISNLSDAELAARIRQLTAEEGDALPHPQGEGAEAEGEPPQVLEATPGPEGLPD